MLQEVTSHFEMCEASLTPRSWNYHSLLNGQWITSKFPSFSDPATTTFEIGCKLASLSFPVCSGLPDNRSLQCQSWGNCQQFLELWGSGINWVQMWADHRYGTVIQVLGSSFERCQAWEQDWWLGSSRFSPGSTLSSLSQSAETWVCFQSSSSCFYPIHFRKLL